MSKKILANYQDVLYGLGSAGKVKEHVFSGVEDWRWGGGGTSICVSSKCLLKKL